MAVNEVLCKITRYFQSFLAKATWNHITVGGYMSSPCIKYKHSMQGLQTEKWDICHMKCAVCLEKSLNHWKYTVGFNPEWRRFQVGHYCIKCSILLYKSGQIFIKLILFQRSKMKVFMTCKNAPKINDISILWRHQKCTLFSYVWFRSHHTLVL